MKTTYKGIKRDIIRELSPTGVAVIGYKKDENIRDLIFPLMADFAKVDDCLYLDHIENAFETQKDFLEYVSRVPKKQWEKAEFDYLKLPKFHQRNAINNYINSDLRCHFRKDGISPKALQTILSLYKGTNRKTRTVYINDMSEMSEQFKEQMLEICNSINTEDLLYHLCKKNNCRIITINKLSDDSKNKLTLDIYK